MKHIKSFFPSVSELGVILFIIFTPLFHGSVHLFGYAFSQSLAFLMFFLLLIRIFIVPDQPILYPSTIFIILAFFVLVFFQTIPIPPRVLSIISPKTFQLCQTYLGSAPARRWTVSFYPFATTDGLVCLVAAFCIFFFVINMVEKKSSFMRIFLVMILWAVALAFYGIVRKFSTSTEVQEFSTFVSRNHYSAYMITVVPIAIGYAFSFRDIYRKILFGFFASIIIVSVFISASRAGVVSMIFSLFMLFIFLLGKGVIRKNLKLIAAVILFLMILVILGDFSTFQQRVIKAEIGLGLLGRWAIVRDSLEIVKDFPLLGVGLGNFKYIFTLYKTFPGIPQYHFLHNEHLQLLVETGFVGFLLCGLFFILVFRDILKKLTDRRDYFIINIVTAGLCGLAGVLFHSLFDFNFHVPAVLFAFWLILGLLYKLVNTHFNDAEKEV